MWFSNYAHELQLVNLFCTVRANRVDTQRGWFVPWLDEKSIPLFQFVARDYSPHGDDVRPVSVVTAPGRRSAVRARHRYLPRDGAFLVEPVRSYVRRGDPWKMRY